jgi:hypothetical protein
VSKVLVWKDEAWAAPEEPARNWFDGVRGYYEGLDAERAEQLYTGPFRLMTQAEKAQFERELILEGML